MTTAPLPEFRVAELRDLDEAREPWVTLSRSEANIFNTWDWISLWWRHFGAYRPLRMAVCRREDGSVAAILPLYEAGTRPLRVVRFLGHGPTDRHGPVCAPRDVQAATQALRRWLDAGPRAWDLFVGEKLPGDEWGSLLGGQRVRSESSSVVQIVGRSWDEYLESRSVNFRQQLRTRERRLHQAHDVRYRLVEDSSTLEADLVVLFELHDLRWGKGVSSGFVGSRRAFHADFAAVALRNGWLRLWFLELDGRPAAALYGFRFGGADWFYQAGRDPAFESASVGILLLAHTIRAACNDGIPTYRLLRGDQPYKQRFATDDPGLDTFVVGRGVWGRAAEAATGALLRLPRRWREPIVRRGG